MNTAYVYLQLYRLFDEHTPIPVDCGELCGKACCKGDDCGMYLFPGEKSVYELLNEDWITIEKSDFDYTFENKKYNVPLAMCSGNCDRFARPLSCRICPLTPVLNEFDEIEIIVDPRAKPICPLAKSYEVSDFDPVFVKKVKRCFNMLYQNRQFAAFLKEYSAVINEYRRFYK